MRTLICAVLLPAALAIPAVAQTGRTPAPSPYAAEAEATRAALEEARILRGVNRVQLTPEQAGTLVQILNNWERQLQVADQNAAGKMSPAAAAIREALARNDDSIVEPLPAEQAYHGSRQERQLRQDAARRTTRDQLSDFLQKGLNPTQAQALLAVAKEALVQSRLADRGRGRDNAGGLPDRGPGGFGRGGGNALQELEQLRQASPEQYAARKQAAVYRYSGWFNSDAARQFFQQQRGGPGATGAGGAGAPGAAGGGDRGPRRGPGGGPGGPGGFGGPGGRRGPGGPGGPPAINLPPITDPAIQRRANSYSQLLDRVRAMTPAQWQTQRQGIADQIEREREAMRAESASPEELLQRFIEEFLLQPRSAGALRARFQLAEAPAEM